MEHTTTTKWAAYIGAGQHQVMETSISYDIPEGINDSQLSSIEKIVRDGIKSVAESCARDHAKEVKELTVTRLNDDKDSCCFNVLVLTMETGMVDDENTMAEIFCRSKWFGFIGRRGGLSSPVDNTRVTATGRKARYNWQS